MNVSHNKIRVRNHESRFDELQLRRKNTLEITLRDFEANVAEQRAIQESQRRATTTIPAALAIGVPLLLKPISEVGGHEIAAYVLTGFSLLFLLLSYNYLGLTHAIYRLTSDREERIKPLLASLVPSGDSQLVVDGEAFLRRRFRKLGCGWEYTLVLGTELLILLSSSYLCALLAVHLLWSAGNHAAAILLVPVLGMATVPLAVSSFKIFRVTRHQDV
jgi:hypothetical protein